MAISKEAEWWTRHLAKLRRAYKGSYPSEAEAVFTEIEEAALQRIQSHPAYGLLIEPNQLIKQLNELMLFMITNWPGYFTGEPDFISTIVKYTRGQRWPTLYNVDTVYTNVVLYELACDACDVYLYLPGFMDSFLTKRAEHQEQQQARSRRTPHEHTTYSK